MPKLFITLLMAVLVTSAGIAQTILPSGQQQQWTPDHGQLKVDNKDVVLFVAFDKKTRGFVRIDDKGSEKWSSPLETKNQVLGIAKINGNVVAITANDESKKDWATLITKINIMPLDVASGKMGPEKTIIQLPGHYVEPTVYKDEDGNLNAILIRHTKWNGEATVFTVGKMETEKQQTTRLEIYTVSNDLTARMQHSYPFADDVRMESISLSKNGELTTFTRNFSNDKIVVEQFANGSRKGMASTTLEVPLKHIDGGFGLSGAVNPANSNEAYCVMSYDRKRKDYFVKVCRFDLANSTAQVQQIEVNAEYREHLEKTAAAPPNEKINIEKRNYQYIIPTVVDFYKGKPVIITEIGASYVHQKSGTVISIRSDALITVYNPDLTVNRQLIMPRHLRSSVGSFGDAIAYRMDGNKLRLVTSNQFHGNERYSILYGEIDLDQMTWIKCQGARQNSLEMTGDPIVAYNTIWWPEHMLVIRRKLTASDKIKDFEKITPISYQ